MRAWLPLPPRVWWPALQLRWPPYAHLFGGDIGRMAAACLVAGWLLCVLSDLMSARLSLRVLQCGTRYGCRRVNLRRR